MFSWTMDYRPNSGWYLDPVLVHRAPRTAVVIQAVERCVQPCTGTKACGDRVCGHVPGREHPQW